MKNILRYLRHYKLQSILGPLFKLTEAIFELIVPLVMADIIDVGVASGDMNYVLRKGAVLVLFGFVGLCCSLTAQYFAAVASVGFGTELRHDLFKYITTLSYTDIDKVGTSTLINRMTVDVNQIQAGVNLGIRLLLRSPFIVLGAVIMSFTIDVKLAIIALLATPVIAVVIVLIMNKTIPMVGRIQSILDKVLGKARGSLKGVRVIRAFGRQDLEKESFRSSTDKLYDMSYTTGKISALINPLTYALLNGAIILIIWFGGKQVYVGRITQGQVIALVNYMSQILLALVAMVNLINSITKAIASGKRVNEIYPDGWTPDLSEENDKNNQFGQSAESIIEFQNVDFTYSGAEAQSISNLTLSIKRGMKIGIIGGTGSGKTTLINLIAGFYPISKGQLLINEQEIGSIDKATLRSTFSIVPQRISLIKGTIRDNVTFGREVSDDRTIQTALEQAGAWEFVSGMDGQLDYIVEQGGANLSGGQKQRLAIARALYQSGPVIILDDSTSALDFATESHIRKTLSSMPGEKTVITVSQRIGSVMGCDSIIVMDDGRVVGFDTHDKLLESCDIYKEIYKSQTDNN